MLQPQQVEDLVLFVSSLDRGGLIRELRSFPASFKVDFSDDFLNKTSLDRLRHIFLALCLQQQKLPAMAA
jgi:hypothetical protein